MIQLSKIIIIFATVIPTLAQSWAFSKDYSCKDNDNFWKLYQKKEKYNYFLSYMPKNEFICLILVKKMRQINRKWGCKKQLCHNIPNVLDCFITFFLLLKGQYPMHFSLLHRFHGTSSYLTTFFIFITESIRSYYVANYVYT